MKKLHAETHEYKKQWTVVDNNTDKKTVVA